MLVTRRQADVVDDPAYGSALAPPPRGHKAVWGAVLMSVGTALVVAALVVYAPGVAGPPGRGPASLERLAD